MSSAVAQVRVHLPDVRLPPGDPHEVEAVGSALGDVADSLVAAVWRLRADGTAMSATGHWCGTASVAYQSGLSRHAERVASAGAALGVAAEACHRYAAALDGAQRRALAARRDGEHVVRQCDALDADRRAFAARQAAALPPTASPLAAGALLFHPEVTAERERLETRAQTITGAAARVTAEAEAATRDAARAAAEAARTFDALAAASPAGRASAERVEHKALLDAGLVPSEDGSVGSRVGGFFDALREDVTAPVAFLGGLVGADGDAAAHWRALRDGVGSAVTHPGQLLSTVVDLRDIQQGDWGHWLGTVGPDVLLTAGSGGGYGVARAVRSADMIAGQVAFRGGLVRAQELIDLAEATRFRFLNDGRTTSSLVPGGGLAAHELLGGHVVSRHVGITLEELRLRLARYPVPAASTFTDRLTAEVAVAEVLERNAEGVAEWLGGTGQEMALVVDLRRVVGVTLRRRAVSPYPSSIVKVVLLRSPRSPLGFLILTAYPL